MLPCKTSNWRFGHRVETSTWSLTSAKFCPRFSKAYVWLLMWIYPILASTTITFYLSEAVEPGGGGHWGQVPAHFLYLGKKCPFLGMKVPYFHGIEMPFLQNLSALFGQCPLTFEVLSRPLLPIKTSSCTTHQRMSQTYWFKLWVLRAWCNLPTSCIKPNDFIKLHQVWTSDLLQLAICRLAASWWNKRLKPACSLQIAASLLTTSNWLVIIKPEQERRTHPDIGSVIKQTCCNLRISGCVARMA